MILKRIPCLVMVPTKTMKVTKKKQRHCCHSVGHWEWVSSQLVLLATMTMFLEQLARELESAQCMLFWKVRDEDVRLFRAFLPSRLPHEHWEALDFKIMFLANSVHLGFWNISWTYSPPPKKLFLWKIAFVCRAGPFVLGATMGVSNAIPCERSLQACAATFSQYCQFQNVWTFDRLFHSLL